MQVAAAVLSVTAKAKARKTAADGEAMEVVRVASFTFWLLRTHAQEIVFVFVV